MSCSFVSFCSEGVLCSVYLEGLCLATTVSEGRLHACQPCKLAIALKSGSSRAQDELTI